MSVFIMFVLMLSQIRRIVSYNYCKKQVMWRTRGFNCFRRSTQLSQGFVLGFHLFQFLLLISLQVHFNLLEKHHILIHCVKQNIVVQHFISRSVDSVGSVFHLMLLSPFPWFSLIFKRPKYISHVCFDVFSNLENSEL